MKRSLDHDVGVAEAFDLSLSEDQFISLLPTSLSYLRLILKRFGDLSHRTFKKIPYFYSKILLKGFSQWKSFLSKDIFEEEYGESVPSSVQELLCLTDCSLLGKSINILQYHFDLNGDSLKLKNRLKLFKSIWPTLALHDELMDCHSQCIDSYSLCQSINIINHVVAKISLCKRLLFHDEEGGDLKEVALEMQSNLKASRIHFINVLVNIWQLIVQKFSLSSDQSGTGKSTSTFTFPAPPSLEPEPPKSSNKPKVRVIYQMESNNPYEILDDDDGFDWEAAAREIDAVCQMRSGAKMNESELEKVRQKREKRKRESNRLLIVLLELRKRKVKRIQFEKMMLKNLSVTIILIMKQPKLGYIQLMFLSVTINSILPKLLSFKTLWSPCQQDLAKLSLLLLS